MMVRLVLILVFSFAALAQQRNPLLASEIEQLDALAVDPETRLVVVGAIADDLGVHRNRLFLLRRQTGKSFGELYVSSLEEQNHRPDGILTRLHAVREEIDRRSGREPVAEFAAVPIVFIGTSVDHNSVGTFFAVAPEVGVEFRHASVVAGFPYYETAGSQLSSGGIGDAYVTGSVYGALRGVELATALTVGAPTGDRSRGLGAGKTTLDVTGTVARRLGSVRPFLTAGFANSVFNNIGYQRPYVSDGNAGHFAGGIELSMGRRFRAGAGAFAVRPFGEQMVYSRMSEASVSEGTGNTQPPHGPGPGMGGSMPGMGGGTGTGQTMPSGTSEMHVWERGTNVAATADELRDHGANAWVSIAVHPAVAVNVGIARSLPFGLTTVRFGVGFNLSRVLFPRRHF